MEKEVFCGYIFRVATEELGGVIFERVYQRNGVSIFPITDEGKMRFIRKRTIDNSKSRLRPVSGYIEDNEDPLDCAKKELREELGLTAAEWTLFTTSEAEGGLRKTQYFFVARGLESVVVEPDKDEEIEGFVDMSLEEAKKRALHGEFGTAGNGFAILKFIEHSLSQEPG